ncbi:MAG: DsbA family protein [Alphaproteobacteria bacterium]
MTDTIRYYYNHSSPWTYFGHERFLALAAGFEAEIVFRPCESAANRMAVALGQAGGDVGALSTALLKARWAEDRDLSTEQAMVQLADGLGLDGASLWAQSRSEGIGALYDTYTEEAMAAQVFGAPTYIFEGELLWGQDRLDFLERALAAA